MAIHPRLASLNDHHGNWHPRQCGSRHGRYGILADNQAREITITGRPIQITNYPAPPIKLGSGNIEPLRHHRNNGALCKRCLGHHPLLAF